MQKESVEQCSYQPFKSAAAGKSFGCCESRKVEMAQESSFVVVIVELLGFGSFRKFIVVVWEHWCAWASARQCPNCSGTVSVLAA